MRVWHGESELPEVDLVGLPGGFAYGDYLRCGAIAARAPVMAAVVRFAAAGGRVLGICNGFQVLCETGLLPGALLANEGGRFVSRWLDVEVVGPPTDFTGGLPHGASLHLPVAHHDGNYVADDETLDRLEAEGRIVFRYRRNPNGSARDIAGIINDQGNVLGLMPHPERAVGMELGSADGAQVFRSLMEALG